MPLLSPQGVNGRGSLIVDFFARGRTTMLAVSNPLSLQATQNPLA
jgi:hypothetical protein